MSKKAKDSLLSKMYPFPTALSQRIPNLVAEIDTHLSAHTFHRGLGTAEVVLKFWVLPGCLSAAHRAGWGWSTAFPLPWTVSRFHFLVTPGVHFPVAAGLTAPFCCSLLWGTQLPEAPTSSEPAVEAL